MNFAPGGNKLSGGCGCADRSDRVMDFKFAPNIVDPYSERKVQIRRPRTPIQWGKLFYLYQTAFPASEKKPFSMIRSMQKKGKTDVWYCEQDGKFAGLVITINGPEQILLDYLAVVKNRRGQGIGSKILKKMRNQYNGKGVFLEIELVEEKAENYEERKRRKQFYLTNGMTEMHTFVKLFGVDMELLGFDCRLTFEEYHDFYRDNYNEWAAEHVKKIMEKPKKLAGKEYRYDSFENGQVLLNKKKNHLPAMGWNSWNAFGSGNTAALTRAMADKMVELGLDKLGYRYIVLDDGCYKPERVNGELSNEDVKFPEGFKALADYIHAKGLKFGMYNDIGTNLCAGAAVGTCGHEDVDAKSYIDWDVDFLKVDNCYYLWDNATFSAGTNAKFVYTPNIKSIRVVGEKFEQKFSAEKDGRLTGLGCLVKDDYVTNIGTFDGTNVGTTPIGPRSGELEFCVDAPFAGEYQVLVTYATGEEIGVGSWLQLAVEEELYYDDFLPATESTETFAESDGIKVNLVAGENRLRIMNHRRQENTLDSYATLLEGLNKANPDHDVMFSICEWGKTQPQNWGYKVADSWRILNDITFCVGADGNPGRGTWFDMGTASVTSQYDKAVVMDEFAGLDKGWNDPDMMMIGMEGLNETMCKTHMAMWCMMNSPLMLGLDLRRMEKGDWMYRIIANKELISLNQDTLGIQAKRVYTTIETDTPDTDYITNHDRCDILAKPLADGSVAICFINVNDKAWEQELKISVERIVKLLGHKMMNAEQFAKAVSYEVTDLWTGEQTENTFGCFKVQKLDACESVTIRVRAK